jgi:hypothetical protein
MACQKILPVFLSSEMRLHHLLTGALHFAELAERKPSVAHKLVLRVFTPAVNVTLAAFFCVQGLRALLVTPAPEMVPQVKSRGFVPCSQCCEFRPVYLAFFVLR